VNGVMRWAAIAAAAVMLSAAPKAASALELSANPERSFYIGFALGIGFDVEKSAREGADGRTLYGASGFLFGLRGGFRFNENVGLSIGLTQSRHGALEAWGGDAGYTLGDLSLHVAVTTPAAATVVFEAGPAIGDFFYGTVNGLEDNGTLVVGGRAGIALEQELGPTVVAVFAVEYVPLWRRRMGVLYLSEEDPYEGGEPVLLDLVDLGGARAVHLIWVHVGLQFEWLIP
jgi:hypothetical protein